MNEKMYYYLLENKLLTHGIGNISDKETYFKFESIIKNGGLMSLQNLKELGINVSGKVIGLRNTPESRISFFLFIYHRNKKEIIIRTLLLFFAI